MNEENYCLILLLFCYVVVSSISRSKSISASKGFVYTEATLRVVGVLSIEIAIAFHRVSLCLHNLQK